MDKMNERMLKRKKAQHSKGRKYPKYTTADYEFYENHRHAFFDAEIKRVQQERAYEEKQQQEKQHAEAKFHRVDKLLVRVKMSSVAGRPSEEQKFSKGNLEKNAGKMTGLSDTINASYSRRKKSTIITNYHSNDHTSSEDELPDIPGDHNYTEICKQFMENINSK